MPHLSLVLLGPFQATLDGQPVTGWKSNKVKALLIYLAVEADRPHPREALAGLLWPDYPNASALKNLRDALSTLRQAIGDRQPALALPRGPGGDPPFLTITRDTIQFNTSSDCSLDLSGLADLTGLEIDRLGQVASACRGSFLGGFSCDSAPFEEWLLVKREQIGQQILAALRRLAEHYREGGEYERAITYARKQLELEPWDEGAHQQLMRALAFNGQRSAALAQYETCSRLLAQELGVKPSEEITALYENIRDGRLGRETSRQTGQRRISAHDRAVLTNVPIPLTSFIGRQREMAEIKRLLSPLPHEAGKGLGVGPRLLTLTGAGGCGKTRLAIEVSRAFAAASLFKDGVWWVDLARLSDLALVPQAVATVFDLRESPDTPLISLLTNFLRAKELLLVLDNCEHLIDACAQLAEALLSACPKLEILATSRETLSIGGEATLQVTSLSLPDPSHLPPVGSLLNYEAVRLFVERAATALPGFAATCDNAPAVVQVCCRLDGIPLAIELAAARVKVLRVEQIAARLDNRFALLTNGSRTALPHHMTLRAAIDWSYDLLAEEERSLFRWLAVFAGGWTLEAAEHVVSHLATTHSPRSTTLDLLTALVNKSLVVVEQQDEAARYRMLETIRHYARERLAESGEAELVCARHLDFFLQFVEHVEPELRRAEQKLWLDRIEAEHDNLRAALEWSLGQPSPSRVQAEGGLRLATALGDFWDRHNYWTEGREWLHRALAATEGAEHTAPRARAFNHAARIANYMHDLAAARSYIQESRKLFQELGDTGGLAESLLECATLAERENDLAAAHIYSTESLKLFQNVGDQWGMAGSFHRLGHVVLDQGDIASARSHFSESLRLFQESGDRSNIGLLLHDLGQVAFYKGDYSVAHSLCMESLAAEKELGYKYSIISTLSILGELAQKERNHTQAAAFYEEGLALARELGSAYLIADLLLGLGYVALYEGAHQRAKGLFEESLMLWRERGDKQGIARCLAGIAGAAAAQGKAEQAMRLFGAIEAPLQGADLFSWYVERTDYERNVAAARAQLDEATFDAVWTEGHAMTMERAIEYALEN
jgi:predicted ATPase/DNA-binding SARP family transcriptional activator